MSNALTSKKNDCRSCYKCIRNCPTKSISFENGQASIIAEECVLCGKCFLVCPQNCKEIRSDLDLAKSILKENEEVYASIAPSFLSSFPECSFETMKEALLSLGFTDVEETAIGATIVKKAYDEMLEKGDQDVIISTCCHSINLLIEKHYPDAAKYLAPVMSPMRAHGHDIKKRHPNAKVIFLGPCISKKNEIEMYPGQVDCVLTFLELKQWLLEAGVRVKEDKNPVHLEASRARLFPTEGGVLMTMERKAKDYTYLAVGGMEEAISAIEDILSGKVHKAFIEMNSCVGACINGPAIPEENRRIVSNYLTIKKHAGKEDFATKAYEHEEIKTQFFAYAKKGKVHSDQEIEEILNKIGKHSKKDELNCSSCGYATCRDKAVAVLEGKASLEMCLPYLMEKATSLSNEVVNNTDRQIIVCDESLSIQLVNPPMAKLLGYASGNELIGHKVDEFLDPSPYALALSGERVFHKPVDEDRYHVNLIADVVYDEHFHALIAIYRDVTEKVERNRILREQQAEMARVTTEVIEKNMRTVQEIAQLLGESTAETKVALSKLQSTLHKEEK